MSLRWGILSTANITDKLLDSGTNATFVAVASRDAQRAQAWAAARGIDRIYGSYDELLAAPDIDAVYVPLPNGLHMPWSVRALEAGKHVLCEKPLARRAADVQRAFDVAQRAGLVLAEAFMWRHHPQLSRARELIDQGQIGRLRLLRAAFSFVCPDPDNVRLRAELDGGGLMDVGCYCVSGVRALAGAEPQRVSAEQVIGGNGVDVVLAALLRFPNDVLATIDCGLAMTARDELEAIGDKGSLFLDDPWHGRNAVIEVRRPGGVERIETGPANSYALEIADFEAAVRGEHEPLLGRTDALHQARVIEAIFASAQRARQIVV